MKFIHELTDASGQDVDDDRADAGDVSDPAGDNSANGVGDADHGDKEGGFVWFQTSTFSNLNKIG